MINNKKIKRWIKIILLLILSLGLSKNIYATTLEDIHDKGKKAFYSYTGTGGDFGTSDKYYRKSARFLCINEASGTRRWSAMRLWNIVDINAGQSSDTLWKVTSRGKNAGSIKYSYQGTKLAYICYYATHVEGYTGKDTVTQAYFWHGGWSKAYKKMKDILSPYVDASSYNSFDADTQKSTKNLNKDAEAYADWAWNFKKIQKGITSPKVSYSNNKTIIGPYKITYSSNTTNTYTVVADGKSYSGTISAKSGKNFYITIPATIKQSISSIKVTNSYNAYRARLFLFAAGNSYSQGRAVIRGDKVSQSDTISLSVPPLACDVSLQKYIVKVGGKNITKNQTSLTSRKNTTTKVNDDTTVKKKISTSNVASNSKKYNNPVMVTKGNTVRYAIVVYNNSVSTTDVTITDQVSDAKNNGKYVITKVIVDGVDVTKDLGSDRRFTKEIKNLGGNKSQTIYVDVTYSYYADGILANTAWISKTSLTNKKTYRIKDRDYITLGLPQTSFKVTKKWKDRDNQDGGRTKSIQVRLYRKDSNGNSKNITSKPLELKASNKWTYTWKNLDAEGKNNEKYVYYVVELDGNGNEIKNNKTAKLDKNKEIKYTVTYSYNDKHNNCTITNTHTPLKTNVSVEKEWEDNLKKHSSIKVKLEARKEGSSKVIDSKTVTLKAGNNWKYTWKSLPQYNNGKKIKYTVRELDANGKLIEDKGSINYNGTRYTAYYTVSGNKTTIVNEAATINHTVKKVWKDTKKTHKAIEVKLSNNRNTTTKTVTLNSKNKWTYTWENLPLYDNNKKITYTVKELDASGNVIANAKKVVYDEQTYTVDYTSSDRTTTITNYINEIPKMDYTVEKKWVLPTTEEDEKPETPSITIELYRNGVATGNQVTLPINGKWSYTWKNLAKDSYTAKEITVPANYSASYSYTSNQTTITNTYKVPMIQEEYSVSLEKYISKVTRGVNDQKIEIPYSIDYANLQEVYEYLIDYIEEKKEQLKNEEDKDYYQRMLKELLNRCDIDKKDGINQTDLEILGTFLDTIIEGNNESAFKTGKIGQVIAYYSNTNPKDSKADINHDGVIDEIDLYLVRANILGLLNDNSKMITYVYADVDEDGYVNAIDSEIYKIIKSNLDAEHIDSNGQQVIDDNDLYVIQNTLADFSGDNKIDNEDLSILRAKLANGTIIDNDFTTYLNSDINGDGLIDEIDKNIYDLYIAKNIEEANINTTIEDIKNIISKYDIDGNDKVDSIDETLLANFRNEKYNKYYDKNMTSSDIDAYLMYVLGETSENRREYNKLLDGNDIDSEITQAKEYQNLLKGGILYQETEEGKKVSKTEDAEYNENKIQSIINRYNLGDLATVSVTVKDEENGEEETQENVNAVIDEVDIYLLEMKTGVKQFSEDAFIEKGQLTIPKNLKINGEDGIATLLDINNDGLITEKDKELFETYSNASISDQYLKRDFEIQFRQFVTAVKEIDLSKVNNFSLSDQINSYIMADINKDGLVTANGDNNDISMLKKIIGLVGTLNINKDKIQGTGGLFSSEKEKIDEEDLQIYQYLVSLDRNQDHVLNENDKNATSDLSEQDIKINTEIENLLNNQDKEVTLTYEGENTIEISLKEINIILAIGNGESDDLTLGEYIAIYISCDQNKDGSISEEEKNDLENSINNNSTTSSLQNDERDINNDGYINTSDLYIVEYFKECDINEDNKVDTEDYDLVKSYTGKTTIAVESKEIEINKILNSTIRMATESQEQTEEPVGKTDEKVIDYGLNCSSTTFKEIQDSISELRTNNGKIPDFDINGDNVTNHEDFNIIKLIKEELDSNSHRSNIDTDINRDGTTDDKDMAIIDTLLQNELTGDGIFDEGDYEVYVIFQREGEPYDINGDHNYNEEDYELLKFVIDNSITEDLAGVLLQQAETGLVNREEYPIYGDTDGMYKHNNIVQVQKGDVITYGIRLKNDGEEKVYITNVTDTFTSDGLKYEGMEASKLDSKIGKYTNNVNVRIEKEGSEIKIIATDTEQNLLKAGEYILVNLNFRVTADTMSLTTLTNTAEIEQIKNEDKIQVEDSTPDDNKDEDYAQLEDVTIEGMVWNDKALDKGQNDYNGIYDNSREKGLSDVTVYLYRGNTIVATTTTDNDGYYSFSDSDLEVENPIEAHIKASKDESDANWSSHYSYYVVFEYDGIKYTSSPDGSSYVKVGEGTNYTKDSNAREKLTKDETFDGKVESSRTIFNNQFAIIGSGEAKNDENTKTMNIDYTKENEENYLPASRYQYDSETMNMQSSTNLIDMSKIENEDQLKYIGLGLRGRDIFDLELTSDVAKVEVKVNNQLGVYNYQNKVGIRSTDISGEQLEDMTNVNKETQSGYYQEMKDENGQQLSTTDLDTSKTGANKVAYGNGQGLQDIKVTYKITVKNASSTNGLATVVTNYFDKCYSSKKEDMSAYVEMKIKNNEQEQIVRSPSIALENITTDRSAYSKVDINVEAAMKEILGEGQMLSQDQSYDIYITYTMKDVNLIKDKFKEGSLKYATYNMAEISEYKTQCGEEQTEFTRGLIDKDSAPGSVETERVNLTEGSSNNTTIEYYFGNNDRSKLKYEDDTYATPTLYFVSNERRRTITGTVFEDYTTIIDDNEADELIRTKTGNGKQDNDEPGINGITVELVEIIDDKEYDNIKKDPSQISSTHEVVRYRETTKTVGEKDGIYTFSGFLPGNYVIRYYYGDTEATFTYDGNPNTKSYNGEDFQATNNTGKYGETEANWIGKLNNMDNLWYAYNEKDKVSVGTDNSTRRKNVSETVTAFSDDEMVILNDVRDGTSIKKEDGTIKTECKDIMNRTAMYAHTPGFTMTVEETTTDENNTSPADSKVFTDTYIVTNMDFGIAEVPVTTIDLQKHVKKIEIKDSTGKNTIAAVELDEKNFAVTIDLTKIADHRLKTVYSVLEQSLGVTEEEINKCIEKAKLRGEEENVVIKQGFKKKEDLQTLENLKTQYSLAREIKIVKAWKVTDGNVLAAPGTSVIDISAEDSKLQGARLEVTYEITSSIYAEKNFDNSAVVRPSITGIVDYIDNDLSYRDDLGKNSTYWEVTTQAETAQAFKDASYVNSTTAKGQDAYGVTIDPDTGERIDDSYGNRSGYLDSQGTKYTTIVKAKKVPGEDESETGLLQNMCGTGRAEITLERVLSATESSLESIITSSIDTYEYDNQIEITGIDYIDRRNEDANNFVFRDRVRTADRYIILAGQQHDDATAEKIAIHPPTGEKNYTNYYLVAAGSFAILAIGIVFIKKFVIKAKE